MPAPYPENICFEVHQAGTILGVRIYLLPECETVLFPDYADQQKVHPTLLALEEELKRAEAESERCPGVFLHAANILAAKFPQDRKTLLALGHVLQVHKNIFVCRVSWDKDTGQGILIFEKGD